MFMQHDSMKIGGTGLDFDPITHRIDDSAHIIQKVLARLARYRLIKEAHRSFPPRQEEKAGRPSFEACASPTHGFVSWDSRKLSSHKRVVALLSQLDPKAPGINVG